MNREYVACDPFWSLSEWKQKVDEWIKEYGGDCYMTTDAGFNYVDLIVWSKRCGLCNGSGTVSDEFGDGDPPGVCPACKGKKS